MSDTINKGNKGFALMLPKKKPRTPEKNLLSHEFRLKLFQFEFRFTLSLKRILEKEK